jgi:hypothetical protein
MLSKIVLIASVASMVVADNNSTEAIGMQAGYFPQDYKPLALTSSCSYSATCNAGGIEGVCVSISAGCCSGTTTSGLCPGSSDIKCCTKNSCSTPQGSGTCMQTSACSGSSVAGYCTGPSDLQCCVGGGTACSTPQGSGTCVSTSQCSGTSVPGYCPGAADIQCCVSGSSTGHYGLDVSQSMSSSTTNCFAGTYSFIVPRGYQSTGNVDSAVCTTIKNAYSSGFKVRDAYLFPCPTCSKSAATQVGELVDHLNANCKSQWSGRVWLDIEGSQYWKGNTGSNQGTVHHTMNLFLFHFYS